MRTDYYEEIKENAFTLTLIFKRCFRNCNDMIILPNLEMRNYAKY